MYDNITTWLPFNNADVKGYLKKVPTYLQNGYKKLQKATNKTIYIGNLNNLNVSVYDTGISIRGSICKYKHSNNFETLTIENTRDIYFELSDILHLPIYNSKVNAIEFGTNLQVLNKPKEYYPYLAYSNGYDRNKLKGSLYFTNLLRTLIFYDKRAELFKNGFIFTNKLIGNNYLRYELRYPKKIAHQLNKEKVMVHDLYDNNFYNQMLLNWQTEFINIKKHQKSIHNNMTNKNAHNLIIEKYLEDNGLDATLEYAKTLKSNFSTERDYYRFRASLKDITSTGAKSELMKELEDKIQIVVDSHLH